MTLSTSSAPINVLSALDSNLAEFASGVAKDEYAFWIGAAISRDRLPDLGSLVVQVVETLRRAVDHTDPNCKFKRALSEVMELADLLPADVARIDWTVAFDTWADFPVLQKRLIGKYSSLLDIRVDGTDPDYLLWDVMAAATTYGSDSIAPDGEHLAIAILCAEGAVTQLVSANWDGLIERAIETISAPLGSQLGVVVRAEDLRGGGAPSTLYKFHGCAVSARKDPATYRKYLVGSQSQVTDWVNSPMHEAVRIRLVEIAWQRRSLFVGLSAQDSNIKFMFSAAHHLMPWAWNEVPAPHIAAAPTISQGQTEILKVAYDADYSLHKSEIEISSLFTVVAKPFLSALALHVAFSKLHTQLQAGSALLGAASYECGLLHVRSVFAERMDGGSASGMLEVASIIGSLSTIFRFGSVPDTAHYVPLVNERGDRVASSISAASDGTRELAAALGLVGAASERGYWSVELVDPVAHGGATALKLIKGTKRTDLVFVSSQNAAAKLIRDGKLNMSDQAVAVVFSDSSGVVSPRNMSSRYGRTGIAGARQVNLAGLISRASSSSHLLTSFLREVNP